MSTVVRWATRSGRTRLTTGPAELGHRDAVVVVDPLAAHDLSQGGRQDPQVEAERPMVDVPDVELEPVVPRQRVAPVHLCPAGHTGRTSSRRAWRSL